MTPEETISRSLDGVYNDDATPESVAEWYVDQMVSAFEQSGEDPEVIREKLEERLDD